jgi:hypothetical protein
MGLGRGEISTALLLLISSVFCGDYHCHRHHHINPIPEGSRELTI